MLLTLLLTLAAPDPETAVDAERAFNRAAQTQGQWTAFRQFMTDDAVIFTPQPEKAKDALPVKNPPIAVQWWPAESYVSCDGTVAVNTGSWARPKANGYFTTVWERQADGHYKWVYDGGDALATPRALPERPKVRRASCNHKQLPSLTWIIPTGGGKSADSQSRDGSLRWFWQVRPDGARTFFVELWDGRNFVEILRNQVAAPQ